MKSRLVQGGHNDTAHARYLARLGSIIESADDPVLNISEQLLNNILRRQQPRQMLRAAGVELVEMSAPDTCCGSAGTQLITHYETSMGVLDKKIANAAATEPDYIASGCPGCQMQLTVGMKRRGLETRMQVVHPILLLDRAYDSAAVTAELASS